MEEIWKPVPFDDRYDVSNFGRVRSWAGPGPKKFSRRAAEPKIMRQQIASKRGGYAVVSISQIPYPVHLLVMTAFIGPRPSGMQIAHNDGNPLNNKLSNLRYATPKENTSDKYLHGTIAFGESNPSCKLTDDEVFRIRSLRAAGKTLREIAEEFNVAFQTVSNITLWKRRIKSAIEEEKAA